MTPWTHEKVFEALGRLGRVKELAEPKAKLYPQEQDAAVLYAPTSKAHRGWPIHLNPGRKGWDPAFYSAVWKVLEMNGRKQPDNNGYIRCAVTDGGWSVIAEVLGLRGHES